MIAVDDSELDEDDHEFLKQGAEALEVTVAVLILRIVEAAIDGDQYIDSRPDSFNSGACRPVAGRVLAHCYRASSGAAVADC